MRIVTPEFRGFSFFSRFGSIVLLVTGAAVLAPESSLRAQGPAPVVVDAAATEEVQEWRQVTGEVRVRHRARVAAREAGPLVELSVREGDRVEKGALLGKIESTRLEITRAQTAADRSLAEATVTEREAEATFAERDLAVLRDLEKRGATNPKEILDAETALAVAIARREQARRQLEVIAQRAALIEKRLADTEIRAPFAGTVVTRHAQAGEWHAAGQPVVTLISDRDLEVWLSVPQRYYAAFEDPKLAIEITTSVGRFASTSVRVVPEVDPGTRNFPVIVRVEDARGALASGMSVRANVPTGEAITALTIHRDGVLRGDTGAFVYVAQATAPDAPAQAMMIPIREQFSVGERVVVQGPLQPGASVIIEGNERLFPTAPVIPRPRGAGSGSRAGAGDGSPPKRQPGSTPPTPGGGNTPGSQRPGSDTGAPKGDRS